MDLESLTANDVGRKVKITAMNSDLDATGQITHVAHELNDKKHIETSCTITTVGGDIHLTDQYEANKYDVEFVA